LVNAVNHYFTRNLNVSDIKQAKMVPVWEKRATLYIITSLVGFIAMTAVIATNQISVMQANIHNFLKTQSSTNEIVSKVLEKHSDQIQINTINIVKMESYVYSKDKEKIKLAKNQTLAPPKLTE